MRGTRYVVIYTPHDEHKEGYGPFNSLEDAKSFVKEDVAFIKEYLQRLMDKNVGHFREYETFNDGTVLTFHVMQVGVQKAVWEILALKKKRAWGLQ